MNLVCFYRLLLTNTCRRNLLLNHQTLTLWRNKTTWLYHIPESSQIRLRCYINKQWMTYTEMLSGNGVITKATRCSISTNQMHTLPELHETSETTLNTLHLYLPEKICIVTSHETHSRENITKIDPATQRCKVTSNGVPKNTRCWLHCPYTLHFITARVAVILVFDNYYNCMHNYGRS